MTHVSYQGGSCCTLLNLVYLPSLSFFTSASELARTPGKSVTFSTPNSPEEPPSPARASKSEQPTYFKFSFSRSWSCSRFITFLFNMHIYNDSVVYLSLLEVVTQNKTPQKVMPTSYFFQLYSKTFFALYSLLIIYWWLSFQGKKVQFVSTTPYRLRKRISGLVKSLKTGLVE